MALTAKQRRLLRRAFNEVSRSACPAEAERRWMERWIGRIARGTPLGPERAMAVLEALAGGHLDGLEPGACADRLLRAGDHALPADAALPAVRRALVEGGRVRLDAEEVSGRIVLDLAHASASIVLRPDGTWHWTGQAVRRRPRGRGEDETGDPPPGSALAWTGRLAGINETPHAP